MTNDYQTMMTLGTGALTNLSTQPNTAEYTSELPRPQGKGWQLKQVIPVHNNNRYLQFFWERQSPVGSEVDDIYDNDVQMRNSVKLNVTL